MGAGVTRVADVQTTLWLNSFVEGPLYAALHYEPPALDDPTASEMPGATYQRRAVSWDSATPRMVTNAAPLRWYNLSAGQVAAWSLFDDPVRGRMRIEHVLDVPWPIDARGAFEIGVGDLYVRF